MADGRVVIETSLDTTGTTRGFNELDRSMQDIKRQSKLMSDEMKMAYQESYKKLLPYKKALMDTRYDFFKLSQSMNDYRGTNEQFIAEVERIGQRQKKATEDMMKNNDMLKANFIQTVGAMLSRSGQSEKISQNFQRMNNPLYSVNRGLLTVTSRLEGIARAGSPAVLALKMLGPTANMKQLNDMTRMITQGLMRFTAVSLIAGASAGIFYASLFKGAMKIPAFAKSFQNMSDSIKQAFQPLIDLFAQIMIPVMNFIGLIGGMITKFNSLHPTIAKVVAGFILLVPALTLLLSPLAIGIGLTGGLTASLSALWVVIGPVIVGFATMMGTVLLVAGVLTGLIAVIVLLWKKNEAFRNGLIAIWESIKASAITTWNFIYKNIIKPIITAVVTFVKQQLDVLKKFWDENGKNIMKIVTTIFGFIRAYINTEMNTIKTIFNTVFPIIKAITQTTWEVIKTIISTVIKTVLGVISTFAKLLTGDFKGAFDSALKTVKGFVGGFTDVGKQIMDGLIAGISAGASKLLAKAESVVKSVKDKFTGLFDIHSPSRWMKKKIGTNLMLGMRDGMDPNLLKIPDLAKNIQGSISNGFGLGSTTNNNQNMSKSVSVTVNNTAGQPMSYSDMYRIAQRNARILGSQMGLI